MKVKIIYKGGEAEEIFECGDCLAHSSGGWMIIEQKKVDEAEARIAEKNSMRLNEYTSGGIFISSADVRKIYIDWKG